MSGKSYTLREMKGIVDYLTEHGAYSEIKGRKMWMDYASSRLTSRTWQSLKETFLKRILPDITNPYYKLNVEQIQSFQRGVDLVEKDKNKLVFQPVGEESSHEDPKGDNGQPSTSKTNIQENGTGEDTTCSKIVHNRASTETLILENCYETAEDIQKDLEKSTDEEQETEKPKSKSTVKSLRDFIVYTEPLTPMLQEVLDDFATDASSDREPAMEIDEDYVAQETPENIEQSQSILHPKVTSKDVITKDCKEDNEESTKHAVENQDTENQTETGKNTEEAHLSQDDVMVLVDEALAKELERELNTQKVESQGNIQDSNEVSSAMTDTLLPNNQEAINHTSPEDHAPAKPSLTDESSNKRKHSNSVEIIENNKKMHIDFDKLISNTDAINERKNETKSPGPIEVDSPDEKNKTESLRKKYNLRLNSSKSSDIQRQLSKSNNDSKFRHDEKVHKVNSDSSSSNNNPSSPKVVNPCLKSVSLFAEQFSSTKYSDSDLNVIEDNDKDHKEKQQKEPTIETIEEEEQEVILLRSFSTSDSDDAPTSNHKPLAQSSLKVQKDKKLASLFGFTNGGASKSRRLSGRKRTVSHRSYHYEDSESSEWTSASDSEYVSPPRGRRHRYARKYLKPHSARVMSLEEEGGLFVMLGKKIYPLVKDGKIVKNYLSYLPESDPEEEDSYWKAKYVEERKRTAELKKMMKESKQNEVCELTTEAEKSPTPITLPITNQQQQSTTSRRENDNANAVVARRDSHSIVKPSPDKTVKIKFSKSDQEVQLEGHWQHLNPVLAQVVAMFHKEPVSKSPDAVNCVELSSGMTTPTGMAVDAGVQEKINKMESDIFQEIKEKDDKDVEVEPTEKQESNSEVAEDKQSNVTTRRKRGRPKKDDTLAVASTAKKSKESTSEPEMKQADVEKVQLQEVNETPSVSTNRKSRTPRKLLDGVTKSLTNLKEVKTRKSLPAKVIENPKSEDEEVLYKFPSPPSERRGRKSKTSLNKNTKETAEKHTQPITSPDNLSRHSVNSSQGYQDSDASPFHIGVRKKRRLSLSTLSYKTKKSQRKFRSKSYPYLVEHVSSESSNSSVSVSIKSVIREQSTLNSEVYRSESFQHLMPRTKAIMQRLASIDEGTIQERDLDVTEKILNKRGDVGVATEVRTNKNDVASSSNLSLPPSPELSIVEDLSISRSALEAIKDYPTINETQNDIVLNTFANKYLMSQVDVSMPLMTQECGLQESYRKRLMSALSTLSELKDVPTSARHESSALKLSSISETILKEIGAATREGSPSDSLDKRLEQLLLESVKKPNNNQEKMEVDTTVKKKSGSRKRCSTPNKKTIQKKGKGSKVPSEGTLVEESQARCSHSGRRSCPPSINIVYYENNVPDNLQINIHEKSVDVTTITKRKSIKKDVIKVKILRPKDKPQHKRKSPNTKVQNVSTENVECDNESGVFVQGFDDSAGLIHNHSETCLQIRDCLEDSVEIIETMSKSIISLNSSDEGGKENLQPNIIITEGKDTPELFCENAQFECVNLCNAKDTDARSADSENTCYFTPLMSHTNSILTEDLSDEAPVPRRPKSRATTWHLVNDEETNYYDAHQDDNVPSYSMNLNQLFPITCAVPNLSTITESSGNSRPSFEEE